MNITEVKSDYIVKSTDFFIICNSGLALSLSLKSAIGKQDVFYIKNIGVGAVTITANLPDLIDGAATKVLNQYESCLIYDYDVNVWIVI